MMSNTGCCEKRRSQRRRARGGDGMMSNTGCCGMDCDGCEARRATVRRDNEALAKIAAHLESAGQGSFILPSRLRCTGCLAPGVKSVNCAECIPHCGFCPEFPCELGSAVWEAVPEYKHNLEVLRSR